ncbi:LADA_0C10924g1_1 [Lachancea dasiensis]|uniref:LADA_0C10924g1_1 n=1 Tax=Lachancea dasiensis TaxID=1072105 RepID=A0A1G4J1E0_9SACH|nr:LADA_0C10924g1_1 [Lachancea dasiensis]
MLDLSFVLGKHVTFPLMCCFSYLLYKELSTDNDGGPTEGENKVRKTDVTGQRKWEPLPLMKNEVHPSDSVWHRNKPFPYQPFKAGEYKLTMGIRPIPMGDWLVLDQTYKDRIEAKWQIIREEYRDVMFFLDPAMINDHRKNGADSGGVGIEDAPPLQQETIITAQDVENCRVALCELYDHVVSYLVERFPQYFEVSLSPTEESPGVLHNKVLDEFHPVDPRQYLHASEAELKFMKYRCQDTDMITTTKPTQEPGTTNGQRDAVGYKCLVTCNETRRAHELILALMRLVEEDLLLMLPNASGQFDNEYFLFVGCFAFAAGFNPRQRFMKPLTLVHGPVPEYKQKLQSHMNRFFQMHKMGKLVMRLNFSFQTHPRLYVTNDNKGTDDESIPAMTLEELRGGHGLFYRSERQCLVRLGPNSRAMCFSIKTYLWNMAEQFLTDEHYSQTPVLQDMHDAIAGMQENVGQYKRRPEWGPALLTLLKERMKVTT